jgi:hypothetical protein
MSCKIGSDLIVEREKIESQLKFIKNYTEMSREIILTKISNKIHTTHPYDEILIRSMDESFNSYIKTKEWTKAKNQLIRKIDIEEKIIAELIQRIVSNDIYFRLNQKITSSKEDNPSVIEPDLTISPQNLALQVRRELPEYKITLLEKIKRFFFDLNFIAENITSLLNNNGIFIFLNKAQIQRAHPFREYIKQFKSERLREKLKLNLKEIDTFDVNELEELLNRLCIQIDRNRFDQLRVFLQEINTVLENFKRDLA